VYRQIVPKTRAFFKAALICAGFVINDRNC